MAINEESILLIAAKNVPDPEVDGYCSDCGELELSTVQRNGYTAYVWQHQTYCWYDNLQVAISSLSNRTERK